MKKLLIITAIVLLLATSLIVLITVIGESKLSDETLKTVDNLRWKHYGLGGICLDFTDSILTSTNSNIDVGWTTLYEWTMHFEDGKLSIETQDGKWFIEMEKVSP